MDRYARTLTVQEGILAHLWKLGARVFTADNGEVQQDDDDPMRTVIRQVIGVAAQLERAMTGKRLRDGRRAKTAQGRHAVDDYRYGYQGKGGERDRQPADCPRGANARYVLTGRAAGPRGREPTERPARRSPAAAAARCRTHRIERCRPVKLIRVRLGRPTIRSRHQTAAAGGRTH
jgi:hypothetical protein